MPGTPKHLVNLCNRMDEAALGAGEDGCGETSGVGNLSAGVGVGCLDSTPLLGLA